MVLVAFVNTIEKRWNREGFNDGGGEELEWGCGGVEEVVGEESNGKVGKLGGNSGGVLQKAWQRESSCAIPRLSKTSRMRKFTKLKKKGFIEEKLQQSEDSSP